MPGQHPIPTPPSSLPGAAIIIAAYNSEGTIARAVASALTEPEVVEIIVVDDASSDDTVRRARDCDDGTGRLTVLEQKTNAGPAAARNRAIAESTAPWIGILDADDSFVMGRMAVLLPFASEADLIADNLRQVNEESMDGTYRSLLDPSLTAPRLIGFDEFVLSNVTRRNHRRGELGFIKPIMSRDFMVTHQLRYIENLRLGEDFELYARALALGARLMAIPNRGYVAVERAASLSGLHSIADLQRLRDADDVLQHNLPLTRDNKAALRRHYLSVDCRLQWRLLIEAVKKRDLKAALFCFRRPYPVPFYLLHKLLEQVYQRSRKRLTGTQK
jgi:succinoglycan biosynthesis protein ExoU